MNGHDLERLKNLSLAELRRYWQQRLGKKTPPKIRSLMLRELAWDCQQKLRGGMDAQTQNLMRLAVRQAQAAAARSSQVCKTQPRPRKKAQLKTGTKLIRTWRGKTYEVLVRDNGKQFRFRGKAYGSLTLIAQEITGAHWSGPRFFGLDRVRAIR